MKRPGLRVSNPGGYAFRSEEQKRTSLLTAAFIAPSMFENGFVRAHIFPIRPVGKRTWECTVALELPLRLDEAATAERQFAVFVHQGGRRVLGFDRKVQVKAKGERGARSVSFYQPVQLAPGTYTVSAVVGDPDREQPYASSAQVVVPPIPREDVFLVPPVLGRPAGDDMVVTLAAEDATRGKRSDEKAKLDRVVGDASFMPLLVSTTRSGDPLFAMTQVCARGRGPGAEVPIARAIEAASGDVAFQWSEPFAIEPEEEFACRPLMDALPVAYLTPGDYVFTASLGSGEAGAALRVPFRLDADSGRTSSP